MTAHSTKVVAFDLDGTLTQHRSPLGEQNRKVLDKLSQAYRLVMVGAGTCQRIWNQMGQYPIDIIGCYGMQYARYNPTSKALDLVWDEHAPVDVPEQQRRAQVLRDQYGLYPFAGETIEIHPTGSLTFPVLGTAARIEDKLAYDPDRTKRRKMYAFVKALFSDYHVMIGGSSSFDIVPGQYGKLNALKRFMALEGYAQADILYCGDDYREGGNDYDVFAGGVPFIQVDHYEELGDVLCRHGLLKA